ncbi:MAG: PDZ domain-containing protein [Chthonomonas sp.]|nr:PDZ domain-containing protein [Chthonomonas sp.]
MIQATLLSLLIAAGPVAPVEHPFIKTEEAMVVEALVNGQKCSFMFDTGFSGVVVISPSVNIGKPTGSITLRDFVGQFEAPTVPIKTLSLGAMKIDTKGFTAVQQDQGNMSENYGVHCDGIMGLETISHLTTEINFEKSKFIFYPDSYDISKRKPDNVKTFLLKMLPTGNNSIELRVEAPTGKRFTLALDTGNAFYATTHKDVLEDAGIWKIGDAPKFMKQSGVASGTVDSWYMYMKDMKIFGVPVKESVWSIIDLPSSSAESAGTVGFGFLKNFNITFDMERRYVWLERYTEDPGSKPIAETGILAAYYEEMERTMIFRVVPNSPASKAGLKAGDSLLSVDGEDPSGLSFKKLANMMEGQKGTKVNITVSRNGQLMKFVVERDYLINGMPTTAPAPVPASAASTGL